MRIAQLIFVMFLLSPTVTGCASNPAMIPAHKPEEPKPLPNQFIALWDYFKPRVMTMEIKKNGWIIEREHPTNKVFKKYQYKLVYLENSRSAYIITKKPYKDGYQYSYNHLKIDIVYSVRHPRRIEMGYGCYSEDDEEWNITTNEFIRRINDGYKKCNSDSFSYTSAFYRDKT